MGKQRKTKNIDLTVGNITSSLWKFAVPLMLGNVLQQLYNLVDTWVVGHYIGDNALAAVGSSYTLMTFLTSIVIGLCLGSSAFLSMAYGKKNQDLIRNGIFISAVMIGSLAVILTGIIYIWMNPMIRLLQVPQETTAAMREYLFYVFIGFFATFLYNYVANVLRGIGNSVTPLFFLGISVILNIFLDLYFVLVLHMGIKGAAVATVIAQYVSGVGILLYFLMRYPEYHISRKDMKWNRENLKQIMSLSGFTCLQQSVMNFGILVVQGIVNSFGATVMAAFAVAVKIDTIAYMPVGDFGNAFSVFVAQNYGAGKKERIRQGIRQSVISDPVLHCDQLRCLCSGTVADAAVCFRDEQGDHCSRRAVFKNRRSLLCRNRHFVYALWLLPCCEPPEHVGGAHGYFPWNKSAAVLHPLQNLVAWCDRNLGIHSDRMVPCGCGGDSGVSA